MVIYKQKTKLVKADLEYPEIGQFRSLLRSSKLRSQSLLLTNDLTTFNKWRSQIELQNFLVLIIRLCKREWCGQVAGGSQVQ